MSVNDFARERAVATEAARRAGRLCLAVRSTLLSAPEQMEKGGHEPVTIADYASQAVILHHLATHFPADSSLAEERADEFLKLATVEQRATVLHYVEVIVGQQPSLDDLCGWLDYGRTAASDRVWVIDPIDGTKGFLRGDQFAVAVALLVSGRPTVAALSCPLLPFDPNPESPRGVIATAVLNRGAWLEPLQGHMGRSLHVSRISDIAGARAVESVERGHTDHSFSEQIFRAVRLGGRPVQMDSQAKYVAVADGRAEVYLRQSPGAEYWENVWDHAAGALIVSEAGGQVTDLRGAALDFSQGARLFANHGILATNGLLHDTLLQAIAGAR